MFWNLGVVDISLSSLLFSLNIPITNISFFYYFVAIVCRKNKTEKNHAPGIDY